MTHDDNRQILWSKVDGESLDKMAPMTRSDGLIFHTPCHSNQFCAICLTYLVIGYNKRRGGLWTV